MTLRLCTVAWSLHSKSALKCLPATQQPWFWATNKMFKMKNNSFSEWNLVKSPLVHIAFGGLVCMYGSLLQVRLKPEVHVNANGPSASELRSLTWINTEGHTHRCPWSGLPAEDMQIFTGCAFSRGPCWCEQSVLSREAMVMSGFVLFPTEVVVYVDVCGQWWGHVDVSGMCCFWRLWWCLWPM